MEEDTFNRLADRRNLYLVQPNESLPYGPDRYEAMIIAAWTEDEARGISPNGYKFDSHGRVYYEDFCWQWVSSPLDVEVSFIGLAAPGISGIILTSHLNDT